jgi:hypothetical protein
MSFAFCLLNFLFYSFFFLPSLSSPLFCVSYATLAIANLTATIANHVAMLEEGALQSLFSLANSPDAMSQ